MYYHLEVFKTPNSMQNYNYNALLLKSIVDNKFFLNDPFALIDVGCSGGIHSVWKEFKEQIMIHAFDPLIDEIEYLKKHEQNPNYFYYDSFVGLLDDHSFKKNKRAFEQHELSEYFNSSTPWKRSSAPLIAALQSKPNLVTFTADRSVTKNFISLDEFITKNSLKDVDFIKIDTDGADLEVLMSCEKSLSGEKNILGFMVEVNWSGSATPFCNTYHNIDRLLKQYGYNPFAISITQYTKSALPGPFALSIPAQTRTGQPVQGDVIFMFDAGAADFEKATKRSLTDIQILKIACLFDLFNLPDCAAELLLKYKERLDKTVNVNALLDLLAKEFDPNSESYEKYIQNIHNDPSILFPDSSNNSSKQCNKSKCSIKSIASFVKKKLKVI